MNRLRSAYSGNVRRRWVIGLGLALTLLLLHMIGVAGAQGQTGDGLQVERSVQPESGLLGEVEFTVDLTLAGLPAACPAVSVGRPSDIVLVIDRSGSMSDDSGGGATKLDLLKDASQSFLRQVNLGTDRVAVVQFDGAANVVQGLTNDLDALDAAIEGLDYGGGTAIDTGVVQAIRELQLNGGAATPVMIVFTDGLQGAGSLFGLLTGDSPPLERAREAREAGIRVITIGLGQSDDVDPDMLRQMASGPGDAYWIDNAADLNQVYATIAQSVVNQPAPATDVIVDHQFNATAFDVVEGSLRPATAVVNGNVISWSVPQVLEAPVNLSYRLRPRQGGVFDISQGETIRYNVCGQTPAQLTQPAGLAVAVQLPPTKTPTPSATPTLTPTPSPTPTPIIPTWTPTPEPTSGERVRAGAVALLCDPSWLKRFFLLLLLLFFVFWLWRVWRAVREGDDPDEDRRGCICRLCRFIPWLAVPLTLLLLWVLLSQISLCPERESLYFWRIASGDPNGEIWVTDPQGYREAQEFSAISQGTSCVGCHAVSSSGRRLAAIADSGAGRVVAYDLDGEQIAVPEVVASFVNWSPDGRLLAIADTNGDIQILNVETEQLSPLAGASDPGLMETMPAWSADGATLAFVRAAEASSSFAVTGAADIYTVPATGGTAAPLAGASGDGFNYYPAYSPDGRWLAFTRHTTGDTTYAAPEAEIFLVPAAGGPAQRLTANDGDNGVPLRDVSNSWPTWSLDGTMLAFNSKRNDPGYDLFTTPIDAEGRSGAATAVAGASEPGVFEHLPFWGLQPEVNWGNVLLSLWPFLLGYLLLALLYWLCKRICPREVIRVDRVEPAEAPKPLPPLQLDPLWQVAPTLLVGVGGTGRWVLTHLKKSLSDAGFGDLPDGLRFALLDTSERETTNVYRDAAGRLEGVSFAGTQLEADEVLLLGPNLSPIIGQTVDAALAGWFPHDAYQSLSEIDKDLAQGTRRRRPLARAGLITKLREGAAAAEPPPDAARLWHYLTEAAAAVIQRRDATTQNDLVRVVLVGSLAGGMSGVLSDLAFLLRGAAGQALSQGGTVHLEGYFTTDGPFRRLVDNPTTLQINTAATARELNRFQLSSGLPTMFSYTADIATPPAAAHLRQIHSSKLFDELVLFGGSGRHEVEPGKSNEPWATTFASMADVLALRLDRATAAGTTGDYRAELRHDSETRQNERNEAIVASAGSYTIRLPLVDMLHVVHTRWARSLYQVFLMGDQESAEVSFEPADASMAQTPATLAQEFLLGRLQSAPPGMSAVGQLVGGGTVSPRAVGRLANEANDQSFRLYLGEAVGLILNGSRSESRLMRRAPLLGYSERFTGEVRQLLAQAAEKAQDLGGAAPAAPTGLLSRLRAFFDIGEPSASDWAAAAERIAAWRDLADRSHTSLRDGRRLMSGDQKDGAGAPVVPGLYAELNRRQDDAEKRRAQMDQVAVRRYLWSRPLNPDRDPADPANQQDLIEEWTHTAFQQLGHYLPHFYWQTEADGTVRLSLVTYRDQRPILLDDRRPETVHELADELIRLAANVTRDIATNVRLATALPTQLSSRSNAPEVDLVRRMWPVAAPSLAGAIMPGTALDDFRPGAAVGIPDHVRREPGLARLVQTFDDLERHLPNDLRPVEPQSIGATDATALTLIRSYDLMPLLGTPELVEAWRVYARNAGSEQARLTVTPASATVFAAERTALEYERRLEDPELLNQDFHRLHPLLVYALQRPAVVEAYALAIAAGWLTEQDRAVTLRLPGSEPLALPPAPGGRTPLLAALLQAVISWDSNTPAWTKLRAALEQPDTATQDAWRTFIDAVRQVEPPAAPAEWRCENGHQTTPGKARCGQCGARVIPPPPPAPAARPPRPFAGAPAEIQDLVAVAVLAAYRRLAGPAEWERIVMATPRRA